MFIESHKDNDIMLTFLQSHQVKAYPCGRRRSEQIDKDGDKTNTPDDVYYIPFDPEARLNTEANNRKHSSINGFTQTYIKDWDSSNKLLTLSLAGYLFNITLPEFIIKIAGSDKTFDSSDPNDFGSSIIATLVEKLEATANDTGESWPTIDTATRIYANILLEDIHLFSGFQDYYTSVLRNQSDGAPETSLDLLKTGGNINESKEYTNYYFSGLSFSVVPLTTKANGASEITRDIKPWTFKRDGNDITQAIVSLCILEKVTKQITTEVDGEETTVTVQEWQIHQPAYLPKIDHGTTEDSIVVYGDTTIQGNDKEFKVEGTTELTGNTAIKSNLEVEGNINVGATATPVEGDNGGYIVAKNNITAEQDLIAKNDLFVEANAIISGNTTIETSVVVGERADDDSTEAGVLTAKKHVETPTLNASESITTPSATITSATITTAEVKDTATIKTATIGTATITDTTTDDLIVNTKATIAEADIETADINTLTGTTATIYTIKSDDIQQKIGEGDDAAYYAVPVMFIEKSDDDKYQLKLFRVNKVGF